MADCPHSIDQTLQLAAARAHTEPGREIERRRKEQVEKRREWQTTIAAEGEETEISPTDTLLHDVLNGNSNAKGEIHHDKE